MTKTKKLKGQNKVKSKTKKNAMKSLQTENTTETSITINIELQQH